MMDLRENVCNVFLKRRLYDLGKSYDDDLTAIAISAGCLLKVQRNIKAEDDGLYSCVFNCFSNDMDEDSVDYSEIIEILEEELSVCLREQDKYFSEMPYGFTVMITPEMLQDYEEFVTFEMCADDYSVKCLLKQEEAEDEVDIVKYLGRSGVDKLPVNTQRRGKLLQEGVEMRRCE